MSQLKEYRREMVRRLPGDQLGRVETLASATTTTAVVTQLATGTRASADFAGRWMLRAEAASAPADRVRRCSAFTASSGTLTHAGTNYADTTATSEFLEIWNHEPYMIDNAVQMALGRLVRCDRTEFPTVSGQMRYPLNQLAWITGAGQIDRITYSPNPVISRDRHLEKWNTVNATTGALNPDWWTLAGASGTMSRSSSINRRSATSTALTRAGTNVTLTQTIGLLINGTAVTNGEDARGKTLTIVGVGYATAASRLRFQIYDGTQTISTGYHSGGSSWEELSATITVAAAATTLTIAASLETGDTTAYVDECYAVENAITDGVRRDAFSEYEIPKVLDQGFANPVLLVDPRGRGGQIIVYSRRPYPQFDSTRVAGGTADADSSDAPLIEVATMAIARLFEGLARTGGEDTSRYAQIAGDWNNRAEHLGLAHYVQTEQPKGGINLPRPRLVSASPRRF